MPANPTSHTTAPTAPPARPTGAKPSWSAPAVECHRTGAEVTAYAGRVTPWRNR
ncbi:pyrroloquinoline quinone precursor peptide PqqA [Kitasatospora sp. RB6PN24]|uniref:pyrroloquinoline quinone precursor peptide PqqA n=1 Tax=Kitasatospora humi TaxID=2893891 RepID=UPI001E33D2D2|nr:pyrroloquinoline quinone precursor peptide PqqA [Kitasatospora humi]MCC9311499.1 pyrroloquinoline quinone precursor peptide PqqA [Kitasatospora humi]